jgi:hypothetical protein
VSKGTPAFIERAYIWPISWLTCLERTAVSPYLHPQVIRAPLARTMTLRHSPLRCRIAVSRVDMSGTVDPRSR